MTIDDWRARYDYLNAETDRLRAEVERLKGQLELEENNGPYPDFSCGTFAAQRGIELKPAGGPTYTTTIKHWRGLIEERDAARAEAERLREDAGRARWCEEMKADVGWSQVDKRWVVNAGERRYNHPDRNAAIDAAMRGGK